MQVWYENFLEDEWEQKLNKYHIKNLLLYEKIFAIKLLKILIVNI
jgi:hypothetical protein